MLSKLIKEKIHERWGKEVLYPKDCENLAHHISVSCKTPISASTLLRLYGFVRAREPREYTKNIISQYLGYKNWQLLLKALDKGTEQPEKIIERLSSKQINSGQIVQIAYEPQKVIEIKKTGVSFLVVSSNDKRLLLNDEVKFQSMELHYPLTFTHVIRLGNSLGRVQLATVSGITSIKKDYDTLVL